MSAVTRNYKVLPEWFLKKDSLGHKILTWCKKVNEEEVVCIICNKKITCVKKGFAALSQHVTTVLHQENANLKLGGQQLLLKPHAHHGENKVIAPVVTREPSAEVTLFNIKEASTKAEIIWTLKSIQNNMAASVSDDLREVFNAMFPGAVPDNFHLGRTKVSYLITEALGPYFQDELLSDLQKSAFSLLYDETVNNAGKKELQFVARFWSENEKQVVSRHLKTVFLGHATADDILKEIKKVLHESGLSNRSILMLGSDGPNVNKKVWHLFNQELLEERGRGLLDIGTCNLHIVHNAFLRGIEEFGETASHLIIDIYHFFKKYPSRWEDFETIQKKIDIPQHHFIKHVSSRWLTIGPSSQRILEQWPALEKYFFVFVPSNEKKITQTEKYIRIVKCMKYVSIKAELSFIKESAELFIPFMEFFQRSEPLVHLLYTQLNDLLFKISGRICKQNLNQKILQAEDLRRAADVDCGETTAKILKGMKEGQRLDVLYKIQRHYMAAYNYLQRNNTLEKVIDYRCFGINEVTKVSSVQHIAKLSKHLSFLGFNELTVKDEWRLLQLQFAVPRENSRIDLLWRNIIYEKTSLGELKYPSVGKLVKACLCLSHGNSDVERGFSESRRVLSGDKATMSERCLDSRLIIRDALKKYKNVAEVPITDKLLKLAYNARKSYELYLEEQKQLKEKLLKEEKEKEEKLKQEKLKNEQIALQKEKIDKLESKIKVIAQERKEAEESSDILLKEAHERLKAAINKNDIIQIKIAQGMLEGVEKLREKEREHAKNEAKYSKIVNKRKSNMIDSFVIKRPKL